MRRILALVLIALFACSCILAQAAVEQQSTAQKSEIVVFAAASMTETLTAIKGLYEKENPDVEIVYNFDSSGTLKTQIEQGAECDLFISAAQKQMNALADRNLIDRATRVDLLENRTTLAVPKGNPKGIRSFDELAELLREGKVLLAIGNSDVPVGQYTQKIFAYYGIDENAIKSNLTYASNVKEVTTQVSSSSVDCGIIYATDAFSAGLEVVDTATKEMTGGRVIYPAAVLAAGRNGDRARAFLEYLKGAEARKVFESVGFAYAL